MKLLCPKRNNQDKVYICCDEFGDHFMEIEIDYLLMRSLIEIAGTCTFNVFLFLDEGTCQCPLGNNSSNIRCLMIYFPY
jgi:hypothetical protein